MYSLDQLQVSISNQYIDYKLMCWIPKHRQWGIWSQPNWHLCWSLITSKNFWKLSKTPHWNHLAPLVKPNVNNIMLPRKCERCWILSCLMVVMVVVMVMEVVVVLV